MVRATIKVPASVADLVIALVVAWLVRDRPRVAIAAALAVAFVPVTWFVSAWWGQFESIYALFGLLGAVVPGAASAIDSSDPPLRAAIKIPASFADLGLALGVAWLLRDRPRWEVGAGIAVFLLPAVWYTSAWWGQFESIYVLLGLLAAILAIADRPRWSALVLALAVMTKPQALPFLVPFGAWYLDRYGLRRSLGLAVIGLATAVVLWLPFIPYAGPQNYLANLAEYQNGIFAVLSLRALNVWWLIQQPISGADFLNDQGAILGPLTPRMIGLAMTGLLIAPRLAPTEIARIDLSTVAPDRSLTWRYPAPPRAPAQGRASGRPPPRFQPTGGSASRKCRLSRAAASIAAWVMPPGGRRGSRPRPVTRRARTTAARRGRHAPVGCRP